MIGRRQFILATGAAVAVPIVSRVQAQKKLPVLGILNPLRKPSPEELSKAPLRVRLRELGWEEGKTLLVENAYGEGREDRLPELAAALVAKKVDVIWAMGPEAAVAAARATRTIPIVFWGISRPVEQGLVESFARPGRNATGVAWHASTEVDGKRVELLREIAPAPKRLAFLSVPPAGETVAGGRVQHHSSPFAVAAQNLGYEFREFPIAKAEDLEPAFAAILAWGAQALTVATTALTFRESRRIIDFASRNRLPSSYGISDFVDVGGLVSYGVDLRSTHAQTADYIDRILRGAKPGELPVDLPGRYVTAVNLKTAKALGLTVPQSVLLRADKVIE